MKKVLFICLLAALTFGLAGSALAAVTSVTVASGELNYQANQPITWTDSGTVVTPKYNISMITTGAVTLPIKTQVLCGASASAPTVCTYNWKVGSLKSGRFSMGVDYRIKVCLAMVGVASECGESATFKIIPPAITTQQQVFDLYRTALGNRYNDLNAYDRETGDRTGVDGVRDFIMVNIASAGAPVYRIPAATVNVAKVYTKTTIDQLDWFKTKFNDLKGDFLNTRDRNGIKYAMSNRYKDICVAPWNDAKNNAIGVYNRAVADAEGARKGTRAITGTGTAENPQYAATGQELCNFEYSRDIKNTTIIPAKNSDYNNATLRTIAIQELQNRKDLCLTDKYRILYEAKNTALGIFEGAMNTATGAYNTTCTASRISTWWQ